MWNGCTVLDMMQSWGKTQQIDWGAKQPLHTTYIISLKIRSIEELDTLPLDTQPRMSYQRKRKCFMIFNWKDLKGSSLIRPALKPFQRHSLGENTINQTNNETVSKAQHWGKYHQSDHHWLFQRHNTRESISYQTNTGRLCFKGNIQHWGKYTQDTRPGYVHTSPFDEQVHHFWTVHSSSYVKACATVIIWLVHVTLVLQKPPCYVHVPSASSLPERGKYIYSLLKEGGEIYIQSTFLQGTMYTWSAYTPLEMLTIHNYYNWWIIYYVFICNFFSKASFILCTFLWQLTQ